ncbi:IclR family transcriptional regulator [Halobacillus hunanensis]|uniref:IclR family transcriptional regulator n=1 Tax=Halobacillus hunanensis TaxID=578214 RepID=UPI001FE82018|nr:IclR family transcriptional regulator [Halobacillus hunanensis]
MSTSKNNGIQSLNTGINIIEVIKEEGRPLKFSEIQELTGITKSNLYKYLHTLTDLKMLYRNKTDGAYTLGSKLIEYGMAAIGQEDLIARISPYLRELNQKCQCTTLFASWTQDGPIVAKISSERKGLNIGAQIGTSLPLSSSSGKVFYTFLHPDITKDWAETNLEDLTTEEKNLLHQEKQFILDHEIAFAEEPLVPSVSSAAVPLFNYKKDLIGVLTIVGFKDYVPTQLDQPTSLEIIRIGKQISSSFGHEV